MTEKFSSSDKQSVDQPIPILVGSDLVKISEPKVIFKRDANNEEQFGLVLLWCAGPLEDMRNTAQLYCNGYISTSNHFNFDPTTEDTSWLAWSHFKGTATQSATQWTDFKTLFGWDDDCHGRGIGYTLVRYYNNKDVFGSEPEFYLLAKKGNLVHLDGQSAQNKQYANNPVAWVKWYMLDKFNGYGKPSSMMDSSLDECRDWIFNNPIARTAGGALYPRFTVNGLIDGDKSHKETIELFETHCFGKVVNVGDKTGFAIKGRKTTADIHFDISEAIGGIKVRGADASERFNRVTCTFKNPAKNYEDDQVIYPPLGDTLYDTWLAEDDYQELHEEIKRPLLNNPYEAAKHAEVVAKESREFTEVEVTFGPKAARLVQWDVVSITDSDQGWDQELFLVEEINIKKREHVYTYELVLTKYNPTIYEWAEMGEYVYDPLYEPSDTRLPAPTNIQWDNTNHKLTWSAVPNAIRYLVKVDGDVVARPSTNAAFLRDLPAGALQVVIVGYTSYNSTLPASTTLTVGTPLTPTPAVAISKPGYITLTPPEPVRDGLFYEFRYNHANDPTYIDIGKGLSCVIPNVIANITYNVEHRLVTPTWGKGNWESTEIDAIERETYTWVAYADDTSGTNISKTDTSKAYYGIATGKSTASFSITDPTIFEWFPNTSQNGPALSIVLSSETHAIPCDNDLSNPDFAGASTTVSVLIGQVDDTSAWTIAVDEQGVVGSYSSVTKTYTATGLPGNSGYVTFTATRTGYATLTKRFNLSKVPKGDKGDKPDVQENGDGSVTITGGNGSATINEILAGDIIGKPGQQWGFKSGTTDGWAVTNATYSVVDDKIEFTPNTTDPRLTRETLSISGFYSYALRLRLKTTSSSHSVTVQLYWKHAGRTSYSSTYSTTKTVYLKQGIFSQIPIDIRDIGNSTVRNDWLQNTITGIRIDVGNSGKTYQVDGIVVGYFAAGANYADFKGGNPLFVADYRDNAQGWPTNATISTADSLSFENPEIQDVWVHVLARDAEGGPAVAINSDKLGHMKAPSDVTRWYTFHYPQLPAGTNSVKIWAVSTDSGNYLGVVVTSEGVGDPDAILKAENSFVGTASKLPLISTLGATTVSSTPLSVSNNGSGARISIATHTRYNGSTSITLNGASIDGYAYSTKYWVFADSVSRTGGAVTYIARSAPNMKDLGQADNRIYIGSITTLDSSGGGSSGGGPGDTNCVVGEMLINRQGEYIKASAVNKQDIIQAHSVATGLTFNAVNACPHAYSECVELETESGAITQVSVTTPIEMSNGENVLATEALDKHLLTVKNGQAEVWERCIAVRPIGKRLVVKINVGDVSYPSGIDPQNLIVTHNTTVKP